jgi:hypothetical protein
MIPSLYSIDTRLPKDIANIIWKEFRPYDDLHKLIMIELRLQPIKHFFKSIEKLTGINYIRIDLEFLWSYGRAIVPFTDASGKTRPLHVVLEMLFYHLLKCIDRFPKGITIVIEYYYYPYSFENSSYHWSELDWTHISRNCFCRNFKMFRRKNINYRIEVSIHRMDCSYCY